VASKVISSNRYSVPQLDGHRLTGWHHPKGSERRRNVCRFAKRVCAKRRGDANGPHSSAGRCLESRRCILDDDAVSRRCTESGGGRKIALGIGLAAPNVFRADQDLWSRKAGVGESKRSDVASA
jgi:hypothetical protein